MRTLLVGSVSALALAACATSGKPTPAPAAPVEVLSTGTPGEAAATRVQKLSATVKSVDKAARSFVVQDESGATETIACPPEMRRFDEIAAGDVVRVEVEQGLLLQYQPPGTEDVLPKLVAAAATREATEGAPAALASAGVQSTVTVTAIDLKTRLVDFQGPGGRTFQVKAGPKLQIEKLKAGDKLLATYLEATAVQLEKAAR